MPFLPPQLPSCNFRRYPAIHTGIVQVNSTLTNAFYLPKSSLKSDSNAATELETSI